MKYLIFDNEGKAQAMCNRFKALWLPSPSGKTTEYAIPRKHPIDDLWAVPMVGSTTPHLTEEQIESLTDLDSTWIIEDEIV